MKKTHCALLEDQFAFMEMLFFPYFAALKLRAFSQEMARKIDH